MSTFDLFPEESYDLIQRLKDINAVFRRKSGLIDRYAGVSELALFKDVRKVGILTRALFDSDSQIQRLAALTLEKSYKFGETANIILELFENDRGLLHQAYLDQKVDLINLLLTKAEKQIRQGKEINIDGDVINTAGRHVCILLEKLSLAFSEILNMYGKAGDHPLKQLLETSLEAQKLKGRIFDLALDSNDIFCRRDAILLIGELGLSRGIDEDPFDFILQIIDGPKNRNNYLVTRDGISALAHLTAQDLTYKNRYIAAITSFFCGRTYNVMNTWERENHPNFTRNDCIEASQEVGFFDFVAKLVELGEEKKFLRMMVFQEPHSSTTLVKTNIIKAYLAWYQQESNSNSNELTPIQIQILEQIKTWLYSNVRDVRRDARNFLVNLPNTNQAITYLYDAGLGIDEELKSILAKINAGATPELSISSAQGDGENLQPILDISNAKNNTNTIGQSLLIDQEPKTDNQAESVQIENDNLVEQLKSSHSPEIISIKEIKKLEKEICQLYEDRQQLVTAAGTILLKADPSIENAQNFLRNLKEWGLDRRCRALSKSVQEAANQSRRESLWMLYELSHSLNQKNIEITSSLVTINEQEITSNFESESDVSILCVLELFKSRLSPNQRNYLEKSTHGQQSTPISACAEMEYIMLGRERAADFSQVLLKFLPQELISHSFLHEIFLYRFLPFLAQSEIMVSRPEDTQRVLNVTKSLGSVIFDSRCSPEIKEILRTHLSPGYCFRLRSRLLRSMLANLHRRRIDSTGLRQDYLNLYRAGFFSKSHQESNSLFMEDEETSLAKKLFEGIEGIQFRYQAVDLPIVFKDEKNRYTIAEAETYEKSDLISLLHTIELEDNERKNLRVYMRKQKYPESLIFVGKNFSDEDVFKQLKENRRGQEVALADDVFQLPIDAKIVGQVINIVQDGCWVNVGLRNKLIFVDLMKLLGRDRAQLSLDEIQQSLLNLHGSFLVFQLRSISYEKNKSGALITGMDLTRSRQILTDNLQPKLMITATVQSVTQREEKPINGKENLFGVNLDWEGKPIFVPLEELSWHAQIEWIEKGWIDEFRNHKSYNVVFNGSSWSIKDCPACIENFAEIIYQQGKEPFEITFIRGSSNGYEFEIEPGQNCLIPADRIQERGENGDYQFALPNSKLKVHDMLKVRFVECEIEGKKEVILRIDNIVPDLVGSELLRKGARISGVIEKINREEGTALIIANLPELKKFKFIVQNLPPEEDTAVHLDAGKEISGYIIQVNRLYNEAWLNYKPAMPQDLEVGQKYYCTVIGKTSSFLRVRYANVVGTIEEKMLTYGHEHILDKYQIGEKFYVTLDEEKHLALRDKQNDPEKGLKWEDRLTATLILRQDNLQLIANLGLNLEQKKTKCQGIITSSRANEIIQFENIDGHFELNLNNFNVSNATNNMEFLPGHQIALELEGVNQLKVIVRQARIHFRLAPPTRDLNAWLRITDILEPGQTVRCIYVRTHWNANRQQVEKSWCQFETETGAWFKVQLGQLPNSKGKWQLSEENREISIKQESQNGKNELCPGDSLIIALDENYSIQIENFELGILHNALEGETEKPAITARVFEHTHDGGFLAELLSMKKNEQVLLFRRGLVGKGSIRQFSETPKIKQDVQVQLQNSHQVYDLKGTDYRLRIDLEPHFTPQPTAPKRQPLPPVSPNIVPVIVPVQPVTQPETVKPTVLTEKQPVVPVIAIASKPLPPAPPTHEAIVIFLENLIKEQETESAKNYRGKIARYNEQQESFEVQLEKLRSIPCKCYLSRDEVSFNGTRQYDSLGSFEEGMLNEFSVLSINPEQERVEVSLKRNPVKNLQDAGNLLDWQAGTLLSGVVFVKDDNEAESVTLEIIPGFLVQAPWYLLEIDSIPYIRCDRSLIGSGDSLNLRVKTSGEFLLNVLDYQLTPLRRYSSPRRVYYGAVGETEDGRIRVKIEGIPQKSVKCYIDPSINVSRENLVSYDLFRVSLIGQNSLFFIPVALEDLKRNDIVQVRINEKSDVALKVSFGNNKRGIIYSERVSFKSDFNMADLQLQENDQLEMALDRDVATSGQVRLSLKLLPPRNSGYFRSPSVRDEFKDKPFSVVIVKQNPHQLSIEVKPGICVQLPLNYFRVLPQILLQQENMNNMLCAGDILQLRIVYLNSEEFYLEIHGWIKSLLHYMRRDMLVRAKFNELHGTNNWMFDLLDFPERMGKLHLNDNQGVSGIFNKDLLFSVRHISPDDPSAPIELQQHSISDQFILARVEEIGNERVQVVLETGEKTFLTSRDLTYRIDNRSQYLQKMLHKEDILTCLKVFESNNVKLLATGNEPCQTKELAKFVGKEIELTFVGWKDNEIIFEISPSYLVRTPVSILSFQGHPLQVDHFITGDVLTVRLTSIAKSIDDEFTSSLSIGEFQVDILNIHLCSLHYLAKSHVMPATVIDILPVSSNKTKFGNRYAPMGVLVKIGSFEQFIPDKKLIKGNGYSSYSKGRTIWFFCEYVNLKDAPGYVSLQEINTPDLMSFKQNRQLLLMYADIVERKPNSISVDVLGEKVLIWSNQLLWNKNPDEFAPIIDDILLPDEKNIWVEVSTKKDGSLGAYPKFIYGNSLLPGIKKLATPIVLAQVLKINWVKSEVKSILLSIDGMRVLIKNNSLIGDIKADCSCITANSVVAMQIIEAEYKQFDSRSQYLVVGRDELNATLNDFEPNRPIEVSIAYILPHGFIFRYLNALGYVPNELIGWGEITVPADAIFKLGQKVTIWIGEGIGGRRIYQMRHVSQLYELTTDLVSSQVVGKSKKYVYIKLANDVYASLSALHFLESKFDMLDLGSILKVHIDPEVSTNSINLMPLLETKSPEETSTSSLDRSIENFDLFYSQALNQLRDELAKSDFQSKLAMSGQAINQGYSTAASVISLLSKNENLVENKFIQLLNHAKLPCTYRNIRGLLTWIYKQPYLDTLWQQLALYAPKPEDSGIVYILCQLALAVRGEPLRLNRKNLDGLVYYAIGLTAILGEPPHAISPSQALSHLALAQQADPNIDVKIVMLIIYEKLGLYSKRGHLLEDICTQMMQQVETVIRIPWPIGLDLNARGRESGGVIPQINRTYREVSKEIDDAAKRFWKVNTFNVSSNTFRKIKEAFDNVNLDTFVEVNLDLAIVDLLQGNIPNAASLLRESRDTLQKVSRESYTTAKDALYRLEAYTYLKTGRYTQFYRLLTELIANRYTDNCQDSWIQTILSLAFLTDGNYQLSREITQLFPPDSNRSLPEYHLMFLYWAHKDQETPMPLPQIELLRIAMLRDDRFGMPTMPFSLRLSPKIRNLPYSEMVNVAHDYDLAPFAINLYHKDTEFKHWMGNPVVAKYMSEMALHVGQTKVAKDIITQYFRYKVGKEKQEEIAAREAFTFYRNYGFLRDWLSLAKNNSGVDWKNVTRNLVNDYELFVKNVNNWLDLRSDKPEEVSLNSIISLIKYWMNSEESRLYVGKRVMDLTSNNPELARSIWNDRETRQTILQALSQSFDYASIKFAEDVLVGLNLDTLEDILLHWFQAGFGTTADEFANHILSQPSCDLQVSEYLPKLQKFMSHSDAVVSVKFIQLCLDNEYGELPEIELLEKKNILIIRDVLKLMKIHPVSIRRASAFLLDGKLCEVTGEFSLALENYLSILQISEKKLEIYWADAYLRIMRLVLLGAISIELPSLPLDLRELVVKQKSIGKVIEGITLLSLETQASPYRSDLAVTIEYMELLLNYFARTGQLHPALLQGVLEHLFFPGSTVFVSQLYAIFFPMLSPRDASYSNFEVILNSLIDYAICTKHNPLLNQIRSDIEDLCSKIFEVPQVARALSQQQKNALELLRQQTVDLSNWRSLETKPANFVDLEKPADALLKMMLAGKLHSKYIAEDWMKLAETDVARFGPIATEFLVRFLLNQNSWSEAKELLFTRSLINSAQQTNLLVFIAENRLEAGDFVEFAKILKDVDDSTKTLLTQLFSAWKQLDPESENPITAQQVLEILDGKKDRFISGFSYALLKKTATRWNKSPLPRNLVQLLPSLGIQMRVPPKELLGTVTLITGNLSAGTKILNANKLTDYCSYYALRDSNTIAKMLKVVITRKISNTEINLLDQLINRLIVPGNTLPKAEV